VVTRGLVLDDRFAYLGLLRGGFEKVDLVTGAVTSLYANLPQVWSFAADDTRFYWVTGVDRRVFALPKIPDGSPPLVLAATQGVSATIALSPEAVFWSDAKGMLYRATKP